MHRPAKTAGEPIHRTSPVEYSTGAIVIDPKIHGMPGNVVSEPDSGNDDAEQHRGFLELGIPKHGHQV